MATRLKPTRINVDNTPRVGDGATYQDDNKFKWSEGGGDMSYEDFDWVTLTGNSLVIEDISNNITPSSNFTVSAGTVKPGIEYVLRVNTGNTPYTMTLGTGVTNPNSYKTELKPNTVNQFKFIATSTNQLELEGVDSAVVSEINWGEIGGTLSNQTDLQNALNSKADVTDVNTRTFYIASTTDTSGMQRVINYLDTGNNPIVDYGDAKYTLYAIRQEGTNLVFYFYALSNNTGSGAKDNLQQSILIITKSSGGAYSMTTSNFVLNDTFLSKTNTTSYTPSGNYNPATKKYVDDQVSAATAGAVSDTAYGSSWNGVTGIAPSKNAVYDKISTMDTAISGNTTNINTINSKIPSEASASNQLADKDYVGDSINSVTAFYITKNANGDQFATYAELAAATTFYSGGQVRVPTRNDYTIVLDDENHDHATTRYIYNSVWEYQYTVNETPLTQAQLNALNSGITAAKVTQYDGYATGKQDALAAQTPYTNKGTTTKVPQISTNNLGQVTSITEQNIAFPVTSVNGSTGAVTGLQTTANLKTSLTDNSDSYYPSQKAVKTAVDAKQDKLVNQSNIKSINNNSLLGSGNINVGDVTGPSSSTDGYVAVFDGTTGKAIKDSNINSANLVLTYGSQSISGSKIFVDEPVLPSKITDATNTGTAPATEAQVYLKANASDVNTKTFYLSSTSDLTNAQAALNWTEAGKNAIVIYNSEPFYFSFKDSSKYVYVSDVVNSALHNNTDTTLNGGKQLRIFHTSGTATSITSNTTNTVAKLLRTDVNYSTPYTPQYNGSPATKKYVDDAVAGAGGISNDTTGTTSTVTKIRAGSEAEYNALSSKDATTIYHVF